MPSNAHNSNRHVHHIGDFLLGFLLHVPICYKLSGKLFKSLIRGTWMWIIMLGRLLVFTVVLLPGWIGMLKYWFFSPNILRNVEYGLGARKRNLLDVYLPAESLVGGADMPVVVFVTGGAWIIGYKLWCALIGRKLSSMGILTIVPDYRNFPQGNVEDMVTDIVAAVAWTSKNARAYGGDPQKIVLAGQSAGAHICMCALMDALKARVDNEMSESENKYKDTSPPSSRFPKHFEEEKSSSVRSFGRMNMPHNRNSIVREYFVGKRNDVKSPSSGPADDRGNSAKKRTGRERSSRLNDVDMEGKEKEVSDEIEEDEDESSGHDTTWKSSTHTIKKIGTLRDVSVMKESNPDINSDMNMDFTALHSTADRTMQSLRERLFNSLKSPKQIAKISIYVGTAVMRKSVDLYTKIKTKIRETMPSDSEEENSENKNGKRRKSSDGLAEVEVEVEGNSCRTLELDAIKLFIGISGPYNILSLSSHLQSRGLDHSILKWICKGDVRRYSPTLQLERIMSDATLLRSSLSGSTVAPLPTHSYPSPTHTWTLHGGENIREKSSRDGNAPISVKRDVSRSPSDPCKLKLKIPENISTDIFNGISPLKVIDRNLTAINVASKVEGVWPEEEKEEEEGSEEANSRVTLSGFNFPAVVLYHGALDISVPSSVSVEMAATICRWGGEVYLRMYENWAHTDAILEGPLTGDNTLCEDIVMQINRVFPATSPTFSSTLSFSNYQSDSPSPRTPLSCDGEKSSDLDSGPGSLIRNVSSVSTEDLFPSNKFEKCPHCSIRLGAAASNNILAEKNINQVTDSAYDSAHTANNFSSSSSEMRFRKDVVREADVDHQYASRANVTYVTAYSVLAGSDVCDDYLVEGSQSCSQCCCVDAGVGERTRSGVRTGTGTDAAVLNDSKVKNESKRVSEENKQQKKSSTNSKVDTQVRTDMQIEELKRYSKESADTKDDLSDCRVPSFMVAVARFVNPF